MNRELEGWRQMLQMTHEEMKGHFPTGEYESLYGLFTLFALTAEKYGGTMAPEGLVALKDASGAQLLVAFATFGEVPDEAVLAVVYTLRLDTIQYGERKTSSWTTTLESAYNRVRKRLPVELAT